MNLGLFPVWLGLLAAHPAWLTYDDYPTFTVAYPPDRVAEAPPKTFVKGHWMVEVRPKAIVQGAVTPTVWIEVSDNPT